ncbi:MAG: hypothetical protein NT031_07440, partial [Planctomycetota bacterium]|nr:hypothetical protein [Planctomycetota bacterium]
MRVKGKVLLVGELTEGAVTGLSVYEAGIVERKAAAAGGWRIYQPVAEEQLDEPTEISPPVGPAVKPTAKKHKKKPSAPVPGEDTPAEPAEPIVPVDQAQSVAQPMDPQDAPPA